MSSDDRSVGQQQPPERPSTRTTDDEIEAERERRDSRLSSITMEPGDRKTDSAKLLRIEAELVCEEGKELDNPAKPTTEGVGESFLDEIDDTDLVPAWTRPWEDSEL